jgi:hypothetical protein
MRFSMPFFGKEEAREEACRLALSTAANRRQLEPAIGHQCQGAVLLAEAVSARGRSVHW